MTDISKNPDYSINYIISLECNKRDLAILYRIKETETSTVLKVLNKKTGKLHALKVSLLYKNYENNSMDQFTIIKEIITRKSPNIIGIQEVTKTEDLLIIIMDLGVTDLKTFLRSARDTKRITIGQVFFIIDSIFRNIKELEKMGIYHRDINPSNIIMNSNGHAKLIDFSLAYSSMTRISENVYGGGTVKYIHPMMRESYKKGEKLVKFDLYVGEMYSFIMCVNDILELLCSEDSDKFMSDLRTVFPTKDVLEKMAVKDNESYLFDEKKYLLLKDKLKKEIEKKNHIEIPEEITEKKILQVVQGMTREHIDDILTLLWESNNTRECRIWVNCLIKICPPVNNIRNDLLYIIKLKSLRHLLYENEGDIKSAIKDQISIVAIKTDHLKHASENIFIQDICGNYNIIGNLYQKLWNYEKSSKYLEESLKYLETSLGFAKNLNIPSTTANILSNLGTLNIYRKDYEGSLKCRKECLEIRIKIFTENNLDVASAYNNLGNSYLHIGDYKEAEKMFIKSVKIKSDILGQISIDVAGTYRNLGYLYYKTKDFESSLRYYKMAYDMYFSFENIHRDIVNSYSDIGLVLFLMGLYENSFDFIIAYIESSKNKITDDDKIQNYNNIGSSLLLTGYPYPTYLVIKLVLTINELSEKKSDVVIAKCTKGLGYVMKSFIDKRKHKKENRYDILINEVIGDIEKKDRTIREIKEKRIYEKIKIIGIEAEEKYYTDPYNYTYFEKDIRNVIKKDTELTEEDIKKGFCILAIEYLESAKGMYTKLSTVIPTMEQEISVINEHINAMKNTLNIS